MEAEFYGSKGSLERYKKPFQHSLESAKVWNSFKKKKVIRCSPLPTFVLSSPADHHSSAVCLGTKIEIYNSETGLLTHSFTKSKDVVTVATYRSDGKLLACGTESGKILIYDTLSKKSLRSFTGHKDAIRGLRFLPDIGVVVSVSDDRTMRLWDVASGDLVHTFEDFGDYVRSISASLGLIVAGCYDGTVKVFDRRALSCISILHQGFPVENVVVSNNGRFIASCGLSTIKIWDVIDDFREVYSFSFHQKAITSIVFSKDDQYLLSSSLDGILKITDISRRKVIRSLRFTSSIQKIDLNGSETTLGVLLSTGDFLILTRSKSNTSCGSSKSQILVNMNAHSVASPLCAKRLSNYDLMLKKFHYERAFIAAIESRDIVYILSIGLELMRRCFRRIWILAENKKLSFVLLRSLQKSLRNPSLAPKALVLTSAILDESESLVHLLDLIPCVSLELETLQLTTPLIGMIEMLTC